MVQAGDCSHTEAETAMNTIEEKFLIRISSLPELAGQTVMKASIQQAIHPGTAHLSAEVCLTCSLLKLLVGGIVRIYHGGCGGYNVL